MDFNTLDLSFLTWLIPTIISILAIFRSYNQDIINLIFRKKEFEKNITETNLEQTLKIKEFHVQEANLLLVKIDTIRKEYAELEKMHNHEVENARKLYEEIGKIRVEFDNLKIMLAWYMDAAKTLYDQLIASGIKPSIKIPKDIDNTV